MFYIEFAKVNSTKPFQLYLLEPSTITHHHPCHIDMLFFSFTNIIINYFHLLMYIYNKKKFTSKTLLNLIVDPFIMASAFLFSLVIEFIEVNLD